MKFIDTIRHNYHQLLNDSTNVTAVRVVVAISIALLLFFLFAWRQLPPQLPLYYSLPWGQDQVATPFELVGTVLLALALFVGNVFVAVLIRAQNVLFSHMLVVAGAGVVVLVSITAVKIALLVL